MKTSIAIRIRSFRAILWDLFLSAVGCFVLRRCFQLVSEAGDGPETKKTSCSVGQACDPLAYVGVALIIVALATDKQPRQIHKTAETHSGSIQGTA